MNLKLYSSSFMNGEGRGKRGQSFGGDVKMAKKNKTRPMFLVRDIVKIEEEEFIVVKN